MLKINTTINLNGTSEINGQVVAYMSASISTDGQSANINKSILKLNAPIVITLLIDSPF